MNIDKKTAEERYLFARGNAQHGESCSDVYQRGEDLYLSLHADDGEEHNEYSAYVKIDLKNQKVLAQEFDGDIPGGTPKTAEISTVYTGQYLTETFIELLVLQFKAWGEWREEVAYDIAQECGDHETWMDEYEESHLDTDKYEGTKNR